MWLIDATTLSLKYINDREFEPEQRGAADQQSYAILSHRWEEDSQEPTFEEYRFDQPSASKKGNRKFAECCRVALSHGQNLVWADTCCIDKRSSAELQEAVNSMFRIYERASICYAYLRDVRIDDFNETFTKSEWFARGWTLQELLAPKDVRFYDRDWNLLGDKHTLSHAISTATRIQVEVLNGEKQLQECSVAQRMSWAAGRVTTRVEDRAYSLLGIFDVNMAMLYGEGAKAFLRLQEEIIKNFDDQTIFVWEGLQPGLPGLLAPSPDNFASSGDVYKSPCRTVQHPFLVSNRTLRGQVFLVPFTLDTYLVPLFCVHQDSASEWANPAFVGIFLRLLYEDRHFMRVPVNGEEVVRDVNTRLGQLRIFRQKFYISIRQNPLLPKDMENAYLERVQGFRLNEGLFRVDKDSRSLFSISGVWDPETRIVSLPPGSELIYRVGSIDIGPQEREIETIRFGFNEEYEPVVYLMQRGVYSTVSFTEAEDFRETFSSTLRGAGYADSATFINASAGPSAWSQEDILSDITRVAQMSRLVGLWALRADRHDGLDVWINVKAIELGKKPPYHCLGHLRLSRAIVNGHIVWDLQLDELVPRQRLS